jgi:hypothetical protein
MRHLHMVGGQTLAAQPHAALHFMRLAAASRPNKSTPNLLFIIAVINVSLKNKGI